jgi:hypothetical protein
VSAPSQDVEEVDVVSSPPQAMEEVDGHSLGSSPSDGVEETKSQDGGDAYGGGMGNGELFCRRVLTYAANTFSRPQTCSLMMKSLFPMWSSWSTTW